MTLMFRTRFLLTVIVCGFLSSHWISTAAQEATPATESPASVTDTAAAELPLEKPAAEVPKILLSGKVVLLQAALKERGIKSYDEHKQQAVLETADGELWPILSDWRGKAFYQDERLRDRPVELVVRKHPGLPYLQVLMVFTRDEENRRCYTDYWCDICSIPMYEIKDCECCQGPIRLRQQPQQLPEYVRPTSKDTPPMKK